jgi:UDP-N-acetylglucosamine acyltransferase
MIHKTAIIQDGVVLGKEVGVGPYAVLEKGIRIGDNVRIGPYVHIKGNTEIGENNTIGTGAIIGEVPQILGAKENAGKLSIGSNNVIREYVTIHTSSSPDKITSIGDNNFLMMFSHIAHDCHLQNNIVICNGTLLAGHIDIEDNAFISANVGIHQFVRIGRLAMISGLSRINQDVPPFMMVVGDSKVCGLNLVGLKRAKFSREQINDIKKAFNILYRKKLNLKSSLSQLEEIDSAVIKEIVRFIYASKRGICGPRRSSFLEKIFLDYPYFIRTKIPIDIQFLKVRKEREG